MAKILITGEGSFVGRNFIDNSRFSHIKEVSLIKHSVEEIEFDKFDVVLHVAAIVHQSRKIKVEKYFEINRDLCLHVAQRAKMAGIKQFIFLSTVKVYGKYYPEDGIWTEKTHCKPYDPYGESKYQAELGLMKLEDDIFKVTIIRPPLIYGIGVKANMLSIIKLVDRFPVLPLGNVKNRRSFTSIENLIALIDLVIDRSSSGIFIAMDEKPLSTTELVRLIAKALNKKVYLVTLPGFVISVGKKTMPKIFDRLYGSFEIDNQHTRESIGYVPVVSSEEGISRMVLAYLKDKKQK